MSAFERCDMTVVQRLASVEGTTYRANSAAAPSEAKKPAKRASPSLILLEDSPPVNTPVTPAYAYHSIASPSDVFLRTGKEGLRIDLLREFGHTTRSEWTGALQGFAKVQYENCRNISHSTDDTTTLHSSFTSVALQVGVDLRASPINRVTIPVPELNEVQLRYAMSVFPQDYCILAVVGRFLVVCEDNQTKHRAKGDSCEADEVGL